MGFYPKGGTILSQNSSPRALTELSLGQLTEKERLFAKFVIQGVGLSKAATKAGYATIQEADRLMLKPAVQAEIATGLRKACKQHKIKVRDLLEITKQVYMKAMRGYITPKEGLNETEMSKRGILAVSAAKNTTDSLAKAGMTLAEAAEAEDQAADVLSLAQSILGEARRAAGVATSQVLIPVIGTDDKVQH